MNKMIFFLPIALIAGACSQKGAQGGAVATETTQAIQPLPMNMEGEGTRPVAAVLKATAFRMSGPYQNNVAITVGPDGRITYFPAPSDISKNSAPVEIGDGWWLNRQGLGPGSVFTRYTFKEYAALKTVPTVEELKKAIIPNARVIDYRTLSMPASEAKASMKQIRAELGVK